MIKVALVHLYFNPFPGGSSTRHLDLLLGAGNFGYVFDIFFSSRTHVSSQSSSNVWDGRGFLNLFDIKIWIARKGVLRLLSILCFCLLLVTLNLFRFRKYDIVMASSPDLLVTFTTFCIAKIWKKPFVWEVRDLWPLSLVELGLLRPNSLTAKLFSILERSLSNNCDGLISSIPGISDYVSAQNYSVSNVCVVNTPMPATASEIQVPSGIHCNNIHSEAAFTVGYFGSLGRANEIETLLNAATILKSTSSSVLINIFGKGNETERLMLLARSRKLDNVVFHGWLPLDQLHVEMMKSDVCYIGWHDSRAYYFGTSANKVSWYMAHRKMIIQSYSGKFDIVRASGCGVTVPSASATDLALCIEEVSKTTLAARKEIGHRGYLWAHENLSLKKCQDDFFSHLDLVASGMPVGPS